MNPGDLLKFREGEGFSWWRNRTYVYLHECTYDPKWCYVLNDIGKIINVEKYQLEVVE